MIDVLDARDQYLSHFAALEKTLGRGEDDDLRALRRTAMERFAELGWPTARDEEWRFTPISSLAETPFQPAETATSDQWTIEKVRALTPNVGPCSQLVAINGVVAPSLGGARDLPPGVQISGLRQALLRQHEFVAKHLAQYADFDAAAFVALNTALFQDGILVRIPRGEALSEPLHLVNIADAGEIPTFNFPRTLIVCEAGSQATIIQSYVGNGQDGQASTFTNAVTEMVIADNANIEHCKVQTDSKLAIHFETLQLLQHRGSRFASQAITLGGRMVRNEIKAVLNGEGCECTLNGLYVGSDSQHIDNRTFIDHAMPHCASHELYKGILDGKAKGVFNGKILVRQDAQKTDAKQTNRTLLLSDDATINTKPQLEIFADDVKCTHGATVGQLANEAVFYLRSRGIGADQARAILTYAFADDILQHIKVGALRRDLEGHFLAAQHLPADLREEETA